MLYNTIIAQFHRNINKIIEISIFLMKLAHCEKNNTALFLVIINYNTPIFACKVYDVPKTRH